MELEEKFVKVKDGVLGNEIKMCVDRYKKCL